MSAHENPFGKRTVLLGIAASLIAAILFFVLSSYAPNVAGNIGVTATPASNSAVGYSGFVRLLEEAGPKTETLSRTDELGRKGLLIVFVDATDQPDKLDQIVEARPDEPTLFVLPKWAAVPIGLSSDKVQASETYPVEGLDTLLEAIAPGELQETDGGGRASIAGVPVRLPEKLHVAVGDPYMLDGYPEGLLIEAEDRPHWVLTDPDFMNNGGIDDLVNARAMFAMIDDLRYTGDSVMIATPRLADAGGRNLGKLLFDPPFLPLTIILLFAGLLALLHGFARFGPVTRRARVFAFGKGALVETTADLLRRAGKISGLGPRYAETMRRRAGERWGAPPSLGGERLSEWLDHRGGAGSEPEPFTSRAAAVERASGEEQLHGSARALAQWIEGKR
ncbi:DUF4350 domain-containing protein [Novosphingopyxis sp.]|uniref:DUF4350 domain-containing protein n=1 Tax=Novosphingopyxis sp. TaxID=2709690 RepID=UPI003B5AC1B0